jgi:hypothetical protein
MRKGLQYVHEKSGYPENLGTLFSDEPHFVCGAVVKPTGVSKSSGSEFDHAEYIYIYVYIIYNTRTMPHSCGIGWRNTELPSICKLF